MIIDNTMDAVFLPGKIHGCEHQVYIIYQNPQANNGSGSWEIEIIDAERILKLNREVNGNAEEFFALLPDMFHGEWKYCDFDSEGYAELEQAYPFANFIVGRDGDIKDELAFLLKWAFSLVSV